MSTATILLITASFLASAVEMVEALTIVLAVSLTRGWKIALLGAGAGLACLAIIVATLGPSLVRLVPLRGLQVVIGALLLIFGLQWLRKAVLRASGRTALHDEDLAFRREVAELAGTGSATAFDWTGFVVAFKGVFLEGLEVAFIVLTLSAHAGRFGPSTAGAIAAFVLVGGAGLVVHRPLSRVPENGIKFGVGVALTSFGTFWSGEGIGITWTLGDVMLPLFIVFYAVLALLLARWLGEPHTPRLRAQPIGGE